jgi:hypothetical protein
MPRNMNSSSDTNKRQRTRTGSILKNNEAPQAALASREALRFHRNVLRLADRLIALKERQTARPRI